MIATNLLVRKFVYQNYFKPTKMVNVPKGYIIPQGWHKNYRVTSKKQDHYESG